ncbi:Helix-turn-helix domain-containing protein [Amycolatopsis pretoriensis]|uniref:Helix-turn-helix domain-containing protein n=1 Tax=Amycolatopsis pretoriensis TaxID=218821 RepID=A0A1H5QXX7_9PSEU|nr:helix-turn-helix transcriptional regulator [Amycolatopsis pretoriensis]SEF30935.1 Helix-turn-helix domain-containing protein [Amycolatopsis pretoriensis]
MDRPKPNARKRLLANKLRRLREDAGLTQVEAGEPMRFNKNKMSRIELGHLPDYNGFLALLDRYGVIVSDYDEWISQYDRAWEKGWWHGYGLNDLGYVPLEADADEVRTYQLGLIPGLLQTEPWMRAAFGGTRDPMSGRRLENAVAVRRRRQTRLTDDPPLLLHAIIDESALRRADLLPNEQCAQLEHIIERAQLPNVTVQVVPFHHGLHNGRDGSFTILSYPRLAEPDIAYVEHGFGSLQFEKSKDVNAARLIFRHLADLALDEPDSIALIRRVIAET